MQMPRRRYLLYIFLQLGDPGVGWGPGEWGNLGRLHRLCRVVILCAIAWDMAVAAVHSAFAQAQSAPSSELKRQYDEAFQETLDKPSDLDALFKFATLATQVGDLEGAISALERMLLINPDLPRVRLELGVLYYRLGSYEAARTYLDTALKSPSVPPEVKKKAGEYLAEIDSKTRPSSFGGEVFIGFRYQSNANLGPATSRVLLFGQPANLNQAGLGTSDWGAVSSVQFRHRYDFGHQDKSALETQFTAYANRQFQLSAANVTLLDLTTGPRFQIFNGVMEDFTLKPFLTGGYVWVADTPYYGSWGGGLESNVLLANRLRNISVTLFRRQDNQDTSYLPTNSQYRGSSLTANTAFEYEIVPSVMLFATGSAQRFYADIAPFQSHTLLSVGGGLAFRFIDPFLKTGLPWTVNLSVSEQWWSYDQPDPIVDPGTMRYQNDTILSLLLAIPFDDRTTFSLSGGRFVRGATVPNYEFTNNSFMFGVSWRF
ncbi:MAG: tetratricopeptide repeat protein [Rhodospirillales bacterium]|nr:tetratricopeptide repeat protein [Rhodospirillales bacterium]